MVNNDTTWLQQTAPTCPADSTFNSSTKLCEAQPTPPKPVITPGQPPREPPFTPPGHAPYSSGQSQGSATHFKLMNGYKIHRQKNTG